MYTKKITRILLVVMFMFTLLDSLPLSQMHTVEAQGDGPKDPGVEAQSESPAQTISNEFIKTSVSSSGFFVTGTTGGDPSTTLDDNKRLLFGYPASLWSTFSTLRVINGSTTTDFALGKVEAPAAAPSSNGTTLLAFWNEGGIRVEQRLYFAVNASTGRMDTTAIEYTLKNNNSSSRSVGLRLMLDVMVGGNDGAPYFILGSGQVKQQYEWTGVNVPDYWVAYESATFAPDSLQGRGQLAGDNATRPNRFVIGDWPQASNTVWDYSVNPSDPVTNDSAVLLYYNPVTIGAGQTKTYRTYYGIDGAGQSTQLELVGLEVTQAIQDLNNSVVLIQDRPTFVRAHVQSTSGTVNDVTARLHGRRDGSVLPGSPLAPSNKGGNIDVKENAERHRVNLDDSFYFELPLSWRNGNVELEFEGNNHPILCKEHADTDDDCKAEVNFIESSPVEVHFVDFIWVGQDLSVHSPISLSTDYHEMVEQQILATFPVPAVHRSGPFNPIPLFSMLNGSYVPSILPEIGQPSSISDFVRLDLEVEAIRILDGCFDIWPINCKRFYLGLIVDPDGASVLGRASDIPSNAAVGYITSNFTPSHELGHSGGLYHITCTGNEGGPDDSLAYPGGFISREMSGDNAFYGFNINTKDIYRPYTGDLMSYCSSRRVFSKLTYERLRDNLDARFGISEASVVLLEGQRAVLVSGTVVPTEDTGTLESVYVIDSPASAPVPQPGNYTIQFKDNAGQELASYEFEPHYGSDGQIGTFALLLPWTENTTGITLVHNSQVLASRVASSNPPTINVVYPNGGESLGGPTATLSWNAADPDEDQLEYTIQYSTDAGTNWVTLATGLSSNTYDLNLDTLAGTDQGLIRVLVSDGLHTTQDQSDGTFTVSRHAPQAIIQSPDSGDFYVDDQTIVFEGIGLDNEDGQLAAASLNWTSNLDGALGSGQSLAVVANTLSEGTHTITLTAQDSDGQLDSDEIYIVIHRTRPVLPAELSVTPGNLNFLAFTDVGQPAGQAISVRNDGDGAMTWSAASDQNWLLLSSFSGTAPTDFIASANTAGLPVGDYTGTVMIDASGAANSPQVLPVALQVRDMLIAPVDSSTYPSLRPTFDWYDVPGATGYKILISRKNDLSSPITTATTLGSSYTMPSDLPANTRLYWKVQATGILDNPDLSSKVWSFTSANPPSAPVPSSPANRATITDYTPTFHWNHSTLPAPAGSTTFKYYRIQVDDSENFSSPLVNTTTTSGDIDSSVFTPAFYLSPNKMWYWRVRAYNDLGQYSTWSTTWSVHIVMPPAPTPIQPRLNWFTNTVPTLTWSSVENTNRYEVIFANDSTFSEIIDTQVTTIPSFTRSTMFDDGKYYWRVRAYDVFDQPGRWGPVRHFTIDTLSPDAPVLQSPLDGATVRSVPTFRWKAASGAVLYQFELDNDEDFTSPVASVEQRTLSRKPAGSLRGLYYWRVRAKDAAGNWSEWSPVFTVTIARSR